MFSSNFRKTIVTSAYTLLVAILFIFITSCEEDDTGTLIIPVAKFEPEINFLEVTFENTSNDAESYLWDFGVEGDSDTSTEASPSFTYSEAGTYTVTLIVANNTGGADVEEIEIEVRAAILPTAEFTFESTLGLEVMFNDTSINAETYLWDFGVDTLETDTSTMEDPSYTFPGEGDFIVSLTVTSSDGFTDTETDTVTVSRVALVPVADFTVQAGDLRIGSAISFTDASSNASTYAWDFGVDGIDTDVSTDASPQYTYTANGDYTVSLTVTSSTGDTDTETMMITVLLPAPTSSFTFSATDLAVNFTNTSTDASTYSWDFGDGNSSTTESPMHTYGTGGTFDVTLTATTADGQMDMSTQQVMVIDPASNDPIADFTTTPNMSNRLEITFGDQSSNANTYSWDFGDGNSSTMASPTHTYAAAGTYTVSLTITNTDMEMDTETKSVAVTTFAAVIQNADFETYPTAENNNNDLVDAWTIDPDNTFNDMTNTPFDWWRNDDLEAWVSNAANTGGSTDKASSSGTDAQSAGGTSGRSLKFDSPGERAYQPFRVEQGIEYSVTAFVKSETTMENNVEGTFYILRSEPADETDLASVAITSVQVLAGATPNTWQQVSFSFTVDGTFTYPQSRVDESVADGGILTSTTEEFVIFYFAPTSTVTGTNEVFLTDIVITTPGF